MTVQQENRFLAKLLDTRDFALVGRFGLTPNSFLSPETRSIFAYITQHYADHGEVPSKSVVKDRFPEFKILKVEDSLEALASLVREAELGNRILLMKAYLQQAVVDPKLALDSLFKSVSSMVSEFRPQTGVSAVAEAESVYTRYLEAKNADGVIGIPWPWPHLNDATRGMRFGQYIVLFALGKTYKTWVLCMIAVVAHMHGFRVLFVEQEMPTEEIHDRVGALYAGIPWSAFYTGRLTEREEGALIEGLDQFAKKDPGSFQIERLSSSGPAAVTELEGLIDKYEPSLVIGDGVYLAGERDWQQIAKINAGLKATALRKKVVIVGSTQESSDGRVTYQSFEQDADMVLQLQKSPENAKAREVVVSVPLARQVSVGPFTINTKPAMDFSQKQVLTEYGDEPGDELLEDDDDGEPKVAAVET